MRFKTPLSTFLIIILSVILAIMLPSGGNPSAETRRKLQFGQRITAQIEDMRIDALAEVYSMEKILRLNWDERPCPKPNPEGFTESSYKDESIEVNITHERIYDSDVFFAEVKIAHPTQLRTAWSGGDYSSDIRVNPLQISDYVNAAVSINADFAAHRQSDIITGQYGVIFRQDTFIRNNPGGYDLLMIDDRGDFHILYDDDAEVDEDGTYHKVSSDGSVTRHRIVNSMDFGPGLIIDGEISVDTHACVPGWEVAEGRHPRTAVGQIGKLHYLLVIVCGRGAGVDAESAGVTIDQLAEIMYHKGCMQAYNLDGGQSSVLIFNQKIINPIPSEGVRQMTDILYFATALDN